MKKIMMILVFAVATFALTFSNLRAETRKYLRIGGDPHPRMAGALLPGEKEFSLPEDLQVLTVGGSGVEYSGWLHTGEVLVFKKADGRVARIRKCGNPIYYPNGESIRIGDFYSQTTALPTSHHQQEEMYEYAEVPTRQVVVQRNSSGQNFFGGLLEAVGPSAMVMAGVHSRNGSDDAWAWGIGSVLAHFLSGGQIDARYIGNTVGGFATGYVGGGSLKKKEKIIYRPSSSGSLPPF